MKHQYHQYHSMKSLMLRFTVFMVKTAVLKVLKNCKLYDSNNQHSSVYIMYLTILVISPRAQIPFACHLSSSPLANPVVSRRTAARIASLGVGAAEAAGVFEGAALIHILAAAGELLEVESRRTGTLEAA